MALSASVNRNLMKLNTNNHIRLGIMVHLKHRTFLFLSAMSVSVIADMGIKEIVSFVSKQRIIND